MAQIVRLRRSALSGKKPTNSQLQLGELSINTTDGKVFLAKSGSLGPSIEEIITTNTSNTGSINLLGDIKATTITGSFSGDGFNVENVQTSSFALTASFALNSSVANDGTYVTHLQETPSNKWLFKHKLGQRYPIFQVFDHSGKTIIPSEIETVDAESAVIRFGYATTGRVIASLGVGPGGITQHFGSNTTWSLDHGFDSDFPLVTVWDDERNVVIPSSIRSIDRNRIDVYFSTPTAGHLNVAKGGHIISGAIDLSTADFTDTELISGSGQINDLGFAITGSNNFQGAQTISGSLKINEDITINNSTIKNSVVNGIDSTTFICSVDAVKNQGAFFDYVIKSGSNMRAGTVMSVWDGVSVAYTETTTVDFGGTNEITLSVGLSVASASLVATPASGVWGITAQARALGGLL
jgi:hypothetical protein